MKSVKFFSLLVLAMAAGLAFSSCSRLTSITLPDRVTNIGKVAFQRCDNLTITVPRNSYAAQYCKENNLNYTYPDVNEWLTAP